MENDKEIYGHVYAIRNKTNGKLYIGAKLGNPVPIEKYSGMGKYLDIAIEEEGLENFEKIILNENVEYDILNDLEKHYISEFKTTLSNGGYNGSTDGGYVNNVSEEVRRKISIGNTGKIFTKEHREKLRIVMLKRDTHPMLGKHLSEETKNKISKSLTGYKMPEEYKRRRSNNDVYVNHNTGEIFTPTNSLVFFKNYQINSDILKSNKNTIITFNELTKPAKFAIMTLGWSYLDETKKFYDPDGSEYCLCEVREIDYISVNLLYKHRNKCFELTDISNRYYRTLQTIGWAFYENSYAKENGII